MNSIEIQLVLYQRDGIPEKSFDKRNQNLRNANYRADHFYAEQMPHDFLHVLVDNFRSQIRVPYLLLQLLLFGGDAVDELLQSPITLVTFFPAAVTVMRRTLRRAFIVTCNRRSLRQ